MSASATRIAPAPILSEEVFASFDPRIARRFWAFVRPYPRQLARVAMAVTVFVASQV